MGSLRCVLRRSHEKHGLNEVVPALKNPYCAAN